MKMAVKIVLAGNPNCGKTTLFNALTGSNQYVGNWPGVTVEKKEGKLRNFKDVTIVDLPGIYSLSPYTLEEVVARNYIVSEKPDAVLNIIDGTNIERNLYLSTQIMELGLPVVLAVNMMDIVNKNGDVINTAVLSRKLGCPVVEISALKGTGIDDAAKAVVKAAHSKKAAVVVHKFDDTVEEKILAVQSKIGGGTAEEQNRFFAVKLLEKDEKIAALMKTVPDVTEEIKALEDKFDDDTESIITNERYTYISSIIKECVKKKAAGEKLTVSDKIDKIATNRILALPIFAAVMFLVYYIAMSTVGAWCTDWTNDNLFGGGFHLFNIGDGAYEEAEEVYRSYGGEEPDPSEYGVWIPGIPALIEEALDTVHCADWLKGLVLDGIVAGVGAVLGFVPQMLVLFILLAFLESCGYMARVAFIMDRIFRKFGLSGKSFIPMLIGTGCGVPGIMASRTIENEKDRRMTVMTTTFIPCGAKIPFIAMIAGALFGGSAVISTGAYFLGVITIICSGIMLKKTKMFAGEPAPFVMELPAYHMPTVGAVLRSMWERGWSFIKKAGTIILLSTIIVWFATYFGFVDGKFTMLAEDEISNSFLAGLGNLIAWIFVPQGFGSWQAAVASITGLVAKENIVSTMEILYGGGEQTVYQALASAFTTASALSFLVFNLLCAPCFAAMGAIKREMNNTKWFWFAIGYQCGLAYLVSLVVYRIGGLFTGACGFGIWSIAAAAIIIGFIYMLFAPYQEKKQQRQLF